MFNGNPLFWFEDETDEKKLVCLNPEDGKELWSYSPPETEKTRYTSPVVLGDGIFFNDSAESVYCLRMETSGGHSTERTKK